jgi:hypothetical protein
LQRMRGGREFPEGDLTLIVFFKARSFLRRAFVSCPVWAPPKPSKTERRFRTSASCPWRPTSPRR